MSRRSTSGKSGRRAALPLLLVIGLAALARLWSIDHALPYTYYSDEEHLVGRSLAFSSGDLNPHWFHKPTFFMYLLFFEYGLYYVVGRAVAWWGSVTDFAVGYIRDPGPFFLLGRLTSMAFGVATVWLLWRIAARRFGSVVGLVSALLLALTMGAVVSSQEIKEDTCAMFFAALSLYWTLDYLDGCRVSRLLLAAAAAGLGTATKLYPGLMAIPIGITIACAPIPVSCLRARIGFMARHGALAAGSFLLAFFVASPFCFLDPVGRQTTFGRVTGLFESSAGGSCAASQPSDEFIQRPMGVAEGAANYLGVLLSVEGMGAVIGSVSLAGLGWVVVRGCRRARIAASFPLTLGLLSIVAYPGYPAPRHQVPLYPFLCLCGGILFQAVWTRFPRTRLALGVGLGVALLFPVQAIVVRALERSKEETRNVARLWIEQNIPPRTKLIVAENGPPLALVPERLEEMLQKASVADPRGQFTAHYDTYLKYCLLAVEGQKAYDIFEIRMAWWRKTDPVTGVNELTTDYDRDNANPLKPVGVMEYDDYVRSGYQYAVVHSHAYDLFADGSYFSRSRPAYNRFYRDLFRRGRLLKEFSSASGHTGPTVRVYAL